MSASVNSEQIKPKKKSRPKIWIATPEIDQVIQRLYAERVGRDKIPHLKNYAEKIGWPSWAVKKRGRELGLARTKEAPWSDQEVELLHRYAWMSDERIRLKLKAAGFARTATAIHLKLKRTRAKDGSGFYSATGLAGLFGCDSHCVTSWIRKGYLKAKPRGTERTKVQGGDTWLILHRDVRQFVADHPLEFDIRKVDQLWFVDMLTSKEQ